MTAETDLLTLPEALDVIEGVRVFVTTRERIKQPEGADLFDQAVASARANLAELQREVEDLRSDVEILRAQLAQADQLGAQPFGVAISKGREVEGLRAEVDRLEIVCRLHAGTVGLAINATSAAEARAERLAGALREAMQALVPLHNAHMPDERARLTDDDVSAAEAAFERARVAQDQETTNG